jgi:hypothetical protein
MQNLIRGNKILAEDLENDYKDDEGNFIFASKMRQRQLFCDFLLHLIINAQQKRRVGLSWIQILTTILKDGHLLGSAMNLVNKMHVTYSNATAVSI